MNETKTKIRLLSAQASQLSQKATEAFRARDFATGKQLMAQAVTASRDCQRLVQEYEKQQAEAN